MKRVYRNKISIDDTMIKRFYESRAIEKIDIDIDAPVVLCGDKKKDKIHEWTKFEVENRLKLLNLDSNSRVLELGCGTGRISKFIVNKVKEYIGVDYVKEFIDIINDREDIKKGEKIHFLNLSFDDIIKNPNILPTKNKFNRFIISGGVFMYINDDILEGGLNRLVNLLDEECIVYISEPVSINERLTLDKFYSENLECEYSAIYRTCNEYDKFFEAFYKANFKLKLNEEFFYNDIKLQKETKQWMFLLER
ncbi:Uncharacterized protein/domain [[Clostridium] sordellii]|uniref:class I SAM-dependent methyltransferase n=1 Tax=Paraclostridium sordellii TaxID=1505 RepID=UPI0005DA7A81|nr:class I SAM-dependent methyltransferase [Paeniclostridium sordellii]AUN15185.1 SAM-dependent methyltransferase [Paeniclostridium sordellii]MDU5021470.1 class I SAM-dependent methyltransferase [Clostridiales bacterium]RGX10039.1 class I SAM-dependent methyltransferase [Paeniclostridium sordellii]CEN30987.1 Uncharacterized protein/domain [[Clostridium] sordellii] [Paeniclostridium sordellii]